LAREREKLSFQVSTLKNDIEKLFAVTFPEALEATNVYSKGILNLLLVTMPIPLTISESDVSVNQNKLNILYQYLYLNTRRGLAPKSAGRKKQIPSGLFVEQ
jgi:hypothetical protein